MSGSGIRKRPRAGSYRRALQLISPKPGRNAGVEVAKCRYFTTDVYDLTKPVSVDLSAQASVPGSFYIVMALKGKGSISGTPIKAGEALLVLGEQELRFEPNGHLTLLTTR